MRHRSAKVILDRARAPRQSLLRHLAIGLITHGAITTTMAKAKAVRPIVERLITRSKLPTIANRRQLTRRLVDERTVKKLLAELGPKYKQRPGGYTRMTKLSRRQGDAAMMVRLELL